MASTTKRGQGRWLGRYRGPDGKERTKTFTTKGEASAWASAQELRIRTGQWADPARGRVTLGVFAEHWFEGQSVKESTRAGYRSVYESHIRPRWGSTRLDRIAYADVKSWVANLEKVARQPGGRGYRRTAVGQPLSAATSRHVYRLLCSILDLAVEDGRLPRNPAKSAAGSTKGMLPRMPRNRAHRYLSHEELQQLARQAGEHQALILVLGYTGVRWGELTALRARDVDLLRSRLIVRRSMSEVNGRLVEGTTKSHATRTVPVPKFLREELEALLGSKQPDDFLFTAPHGGALRNSNFRRTVFDPAVEAARMAPLKPHDLRHTAASLAIQAGANVKAVQRMLGHGSAALTLDVYADLFDSDLDGVAHRLDEAVSKLPADSLRTVVSIADTRHGAQRASVAP